jgi:hypothetical protein
MSTWWWCRTCKDEGSVTMSEHVGAMAGIAAVHAGHRANSPACPERYFIRVCLEGPVPSEYRT